MKLPGANLAGRGTPWVGGGPIPNRGAKGARGRVDTPGPGGPHAVSARGLREPGLITVPAMAEVHVPPPPPPAPPEVDPRCKRASKPLAHSARPRPRRNPRIRCPPRIHLLLLGACLIAAPHPPPCRKPLERRCARRLLGPGYRLARSRSRVGAL